MTRILRKLMPALIAVGFVFTPLPTGSHTGSLAQGSGKCFSDVPGINDCIDGRFLEFWNANGGLEVFGYPIRPQREEVVESQKYQVQYFERNRFELHPENARPYDVLLGRTGAERLEQQGKDWTTFPKGPKQQGCLFFAQTGHSICGRFLDKWRALGLEFDGRAGRSEAESLALLGLPLSTEQKETIGGKKYTVQWFERARFELHPENTPPHDVLLGLLIRELLAPPTPTTPTPASGTPTPTPDKNGLKSSGIWRTQGDPENYWAFAKLVAGDFDGDGKTDIAGFYSYANNDTGLWLFTFDAEGPHRNLAWRSGPRNWTWSATNPVAGDFNGDGKDEIAAFYDYGNSDTAIWLFTFNGKEFEPTQIWRSGPRNWTWANTKPVAGDFDGDGKDEIAAFYDYGNNDTAIWLFTFSGNILDMKVVWRSGARNWTWANTKPVAGDFDGDGKTDIAAFYSYANNNTAIWLFTMGEPVKNTRVWLSGENGWSWAATKPVAGDLNGDGKAEVAAFYGNNTLTRIFLFTLDTSDVRQSVVWFPVDNDPRDWTRFELVPTISDFNGDGKAEAAVFYTHDPFSNDVELFFFD